MQPGITANDVQSSEVIDRLGKHGDYLPFPTDIGLDRKGSTTHRLNCVRNFVRSVGVRDVIDDNVGPRGG